MKTHTAKITIHSGQIYHFVGGYKIFLDGSPQGKTAWLSKPYHVAPNVLLAVHNAVNR